MEFIFKNNCFKNGILPIELATMEIDQLFTAVVESPGYILHIDLLKQEITTPDKRILPFDVDTFRRHCLLNGLDDIGLSLQHADEIKQFESRRTKENPWLFQESAT